MTKPRLRVVVLGGGVAGLASALAFARRGCSVTVVERDAGPPAGGGDEAFVTWKRRSVPQFRLPHAFSSRCRNLLLDHAPDVIDRLHGDGIGERNLIHLLAPPEQWQPDDERLTFLATRRPGFELALRRAVDADAGVELLSPAVATGLRFGSGNARPPHVTSVRLADGRELDADVVLDCGGRRTPVPRWLSAQGVEVDQEVQDCDIVYYARYYRRRPESTLDPLLVLGARGELETGIFMSYTGDHDTFAVLLAAPPDDEELRVLRQSWAWDAAARNIPRLAPLVDPANSVPLHDVQVMAGHDNIRRRYVVHRTPLVLGLLPVGDALCTTNPAYAWGAAMALTHAFAAVEAVTDHAGDLGATARAYDALVAPEVEAVYRESAAMDRARIYRTRNLDVPEDDRAEMDRQDLILRGVLAGALRDPLLMRALLRRVNLVERPDAILDDPEVAERATVVRDIVAGKPPRRSGPTRQELLAILAEARPQEATAASDAGAAPRGSSTTSV